MTITTQDLIDAAKAIGIEVVDKYGTLYSCTEEDGHKPWWPHQDKSQLLDLQWGLKLAVGYFPDGSGSVRGINIFGFDNTFESFVTAIILAAAEIGRGIK